MTIDKFESFLSNSLKAGEIEVNTPINEIEHLIANKISANQNKRRQKRSFILRIAASIIIVISICGAAFFPQPVYAIKKQLFETILNIGKSINVNINSDTGQQLMQNKIANEIAPIQKSVPFKILAPQYIPPGYKLESIKKNATDKQAKIIMSFVGDNASILITQTKISNSFSSSINVNAQDARSEKIALDKYEATLISFNDGSATLIWVTNNNVFCEIMGDISPQQAIEMANSMYIIE